MKQTNNAIKFLMAQYRAIFKHAYLKGIVSAVVLTTGLAAGAANADVKTAIEDQSEWNSALTAGDGQITIGTKGASGTSSFQNLIIVDSGSKTSLGLSKDQTLLIDVNDGSDYTTNHLKASGDGAQLSLTGDGTLKITSNGSNDNNLEGLFLSATDSGNLSVNLGVINTDGLLFVNTSGANSVATVTAKEIIVGDGNYDSSKNGLNDGRAGIWLGESTGASEDNSGSITLGSATSSITVNKDGKIRSSGNNSGSIIEAAKLQVNGGILSFVQPSGKSYSTTIKAHDTNIDSGWFDMKSGSKVNLELAPSGSVDGTLDFTGTADAKSYFVVGGELKIKQGHVTLDGNTILAARTDATAVSDFIQVGDDSDGTKASLTLQGDTLKAYLSGKDAENNTLTYVDENAQFKTPNAASKNATLGSIALKSGSTLNISTAIDLAEVKMSGSSTAADGMIVVKDTATIKGEDITISKALNNGTASGAAINLAGSSASGTLVINATNLTLGSDTYNATSALGFANAIARNVTFKTDGTPFTLVDKLTYSAIDTITNPFDATDKEFKYAGTGNISGDVIVSGAGLNVEAGHYTNNNDITLSSGGLTIGGKEGFDASLTQNGEFIIDSKAAQTILVSGNGSINFATDTQRSALAVLDLSQAKNFDIKDGNSTLATFKAGQNGTIILSESQIDKILDVSNTISQSGAEVVLGSGGILEIQGDLDGANNTNALSVTKLTSGAGGTTDLIAFSGTGTLKANSIWLSAASTSDKLDIGSGTLQADTIRLDQTATTGTPAKAEDFTVNKGTLIVGSSLTSSNANGNAIVFGDGSASNANLKLGYITPNTDKWGIGNGTYTTSSEAGSITQNIKLNGDASTGSKLDVVYGAWNAKDIEIGKGSLTIGEVPHYKDINGDPIEFKSALTGNKVTLSDATSKATINTTGTATFDELTMSNGAIEVYGNLTVNGKYTAATTDPVANASYGVAITGGTINVDGRNAQLTFGKDAVKAITVNGDTVTAANGTFKQNITVDNFATLKLDFDAVSFSEAALKELRKTLLSNSTNGAALDKGYIDLGDATIGDIKVSGDGTIDWSNLEGYKDITDIKTQDLANATLTNVDNTDTVSANVGNIQANGSTQTVNLSDTVLSNSSSGKGQGNFIFNANDPTTAINANIIGGAHVTFENGGNVKAINLDAGKDEDNETIFNVISSGDAVTNIESITAGNNTLVNISGTTKVAKSVSVEDLQVDQDLTVAQNVTVNGDLTSTAGTTTGKVSANTLNVRGSTEYSGNLEIAGNATFDGETYLGGNNTFNGSEVVFKNGVELDHGVTTAKKIVLGNNSANASMDIIGNAQVTADVIESKGNNAIYLTVGEEAGTEGDESWESSAGYLTVGRLDLNGGVLSTDPEYGKSATIVAINSFGDTNSYDNVKGNEAGNLNGQIIALRNSIVGIGVADTKDAKAIAQLQSTFSQYIDANGSLDGDKVGSIVYVAKALNIDKNDGSKIIVDANKSFTEYESAINAGNDYKKNVDANDIYLANNSILAVSDHAALDSTKGQAGSKTQRAAIEFSNGDASLYAENGAKIVLVGDGFSTRDEIMLFSDDGANKGIKINGNSVTVETINGLLHFTLAEGEETTGGNLSLNYEAVGSAFSMASAPVKYSLISYAANDNNWDSTEPDTEDMLHGAVAEGLKYDATKGVVDKDGNAVENQKAYIVLDDGDGNKVVYHDAYNYFLDDVVRNSTTGLAAEQAARLAVYGGAAQAALTAGATTYDAISGRLGVGAQTGSITFADNGQGAGLWVSPVYKNHDSDGFGAQGASYGVDMDLYGVALGGDFTMANGLRVGAAFNVGSGDADGQGTGNGVTNDFDYYGFAVYGGFSYDKFSVVGDISYTVVDNDVEANTEVEKISASMDSTNLSVGVTGQYTFNYGGMNIVPHAGLRYTNVDLDDYNVNGSGDIAHFNADSFNVFSIPVGVTFSKEITAGEWTIQPAFDLTLTANMGDDSVEGSVAWAGISNMSTKVESEVIDSFTYGATLGVSAKTGNLSLGFGVNYTGTSSADEYGVGANARFVF